MLSAQKLFDSSPQHFAAAVRPSLREKHPEMKMVELSKLIGVQWHELKGETHLHWFSFFSWS
jgi:hypothetical protein